MTFYHIYQRDQVIKTWKSNLILLNVMRSDDWQMYRPDDDATDGIFGNKY